MARETKVGLLVGLGFIICFAVILANRGTREPLAREASSPALAWGKSAVTPTPVVRLPSRRVKMNTGVRPRRRLPSREPTPGANRGTKSRETVASAVPAASKVNEPAPKGIDTDVAGATPLPIRAATTPAHASRNGRGSATAGTLVVGSTGRQRQENRDASRDTVRSVVNASASEVEHVARTASPTAADVAASLSQERPKSAGDPPALRTITVAKGDTLTGIAYRHYGTRAGKVVRTLFEANRDVMASQDVLAIGMKLRLPEINGYPLTPPPTAAPAEKKKPPGRPPADRKQPPARWYQIKSGDRYATIAQAELGSSARWQELYELNRDIFPESGKIRPGVRIRLPAVEAAPTAERPQ